MVSSRLVGPMLCFFSLVFVHDASTVRGLLPGPYEVGLFDTVAAVAPYLLQDLRKSPAQPKAHCRKRFALLIST